jgi:hypothetical protein
LSDDLWLIAAQVGMLLGRSQDQLAEDRKVGNPPPFKKDGEKMRRLNRNIRLVFDYLRMTRNSTPSTAHVSG